MSSHKGLVRLVQKTFAYTDRLLGMRLCIEGSTPQTVECEDEPFQRVSFYRLSVYLTSVSPWTSPEAPSSSSSDGDTDSELEYLRGRSVLESIELSSTSGAHSTGVDHKGSKSKRSYSASPGMDDDGGAYQPSKRRRGPSSRYTRATSRDLSWNDSAFLATVVNESVILLSGAIFRAEVDVLLPEK